MRWIVGIDLRDRCQGAMNLCGWIAKTSRAADLDHFEAVHVLQEEHLRSLRTHVSLSEVERMARESLEAVTSELELGDRLEATTLLFDTTAEKGLERRTRGRADTVLLIGRRAPVGATGWTRLGRSARRLVRSLPVPVMVVPPDYEPGGEGPVILATSLDADTDGAAAFAARLAHRWNRPLVAAYVLPGSLDEPPTYVPAKTRAHVREQERAQADHDLELWLRRHELPNTERVVMAGDTVDRLTALAFERQAAAIVVGTRHLPLRTRLYLSSVGSDLAGSATVPVVVVPPPTQ